MDGPAPLQVIHQEHESIRQLVHAVDGIAGALREGMKVDAADGKAALETIQVYADKGHHAKEESVLFPAIMDSRQAAFAKGLIPALQRDHGVVRRLFADMSTHLPAAVGGDARAVTMFAHAAHQFRQLMESHIRKEEKELIPLAEALPPRQRSAVAKAFERLAAKLGPDWHARHEAVIHGLAQKYARYALAAA